MQQTNRRGEEKRESTMDIPIPAIDGPHDVCAHSMSNAGLILASDTGWLAVWLVKCSSR